MKYYQSKLTVFDLNDSSGVDIIGDVHGCVDELEEIVQLAGYEVQRNGRDYTFRHPQNRKLIIAGDLVDRGPRVVDAIFFARGLIKSGVGTSVMGNHCDKFLRSLLGRPVKVSAGLAESLTQLSALSSDERAIVLQTMLTLPSQALLRQTGRIDALVVHAAAPTHHQFNPSWHSYQRGIYGYADDGETDADGNLRREDWAQNYTGEIVVIHGHTPTKTPIYKNRVYNIDTGCVFGGALTMLRLYEDEYLTVPAKQKYSARSGF